MLKSLLEKRKDTKYRWNSTIKVKKYKIKKSSNKSNKLWQNAKSQIVKLYGNECIICGNTENLHCHHFQFKRTEKPEYKYTIDNLCLLCDYCHSNAHETKESYNEYKNRILSRIKSRGFKIRNLERISSL